MNVNALPNKLSADVPLERLAGNASLTEKEKVAEVSRQFEAVLLRQILTETQKPLIKSKFSDNSTAASIYRDMIGNQLADSISKTGSVGLAKTLGRQLTHEVTPASLAGHAHPSAALPTAQAGSDVSRPLDSEPSLRPLDATGRRTILYAPRQHP